MAMEVDKDGGLGFKYWIPVRRCFLPDASLFASGNIERELLAKQEDISGLSENSEVAINGSKSSFSHNQARSRKQNSSVQVALDITEDERHQLAEMEHRESRGVSCPIVGCRMRMNSLEEFEDHYNARHTASCPVCARVYPTSRLLSIHMSETHDSFFRAKVARGYAMYECLVEGCGAKLKNYKSRQQHLVDKHKFPTSFEFFKQSRPSKKQRQKSLRKQAHKTEEASSVMHVEEETMSGLISAVSKLSTTDSSPSSISFGRRHTRGLAFVPRSVQRDTKPDSAPSGME